MAARPVTESRVEFAIALAVMAIRFGIRFSMLGWRRLDGTDFWCLVSTILYIGFTVVSFVMTQPMYNEFHGLQDPKVIDSIPDDKIPIAATIGKLSFSGWILYISMVYAFKGVFLTLLRGLGMGVTYHEWLVLGTSVLTVLCWVASLVAHICGCLPVQRAWQVKPWPGPDCSARPLNYWVAGILNPATDLIILLIPMPIFWKLQVPLRRKIPLVILFGSVLMVMTCSILRDYYVLSHNPNGKFGLNWANRESFCSMIVISGPGIWNYLQTFSFFNGKSNKSSGSEEATGGSRRNAARVASDDELELFGYTSDRKIHTPDTAAG